MTIKRRLFISNILMIVIPIVISIIISIVAMTLLWQFYFKEAQFYMENEQRLHVVQDRVMSRAKDLLQEGNELEQKESISEMEDILKRNGFTLTLFDSEGELFSIGENQSPFNSNLLDAVRVMGGEGTITIDNEEVYAETVVANGKTYTICLFSTMEFVPNMEDHRPPVFIPILILLGMVLIILLTNRFLTKFVFRKIDEPLNILATGVRQIRDGNLEFQINYNNKDEFASVIEDFNNMAARLKESITLIQKQEQNRKELLAGISHDLRSPLTSIKAYSEGLLDGVAKTPESRKNYLQMIQTKAEDIDRMVSKIFLFSKMDMGDYPYYPEVLNLEQEIRSLVHVTRDEYISKGMDVKIEKLVKKVEVYADPTQLRSVFINIFENSLKYKDKERVYVNIHSQVQGNEVYIYVEDNGPGVSEDELPKLFDVFYRTDPARNSPDKGSGLGLAITRKAIDRMDGSIYAKNSATKGLCIVIKLPILKKGEENEENTYHRG